MHFKISHSLKKYLIYYTPVQGGLYSNKIINKIYEKIGEEVPRKYKLGLVIDETTKLTMLGIPLIFNEYFQDPIIAISSILYGFVYSHVSLSQKRRIDFILKENEEKLLQKRIWPYDLDALLQDRATI